MVTERVDLPSDAVGAFEDRHFRLIGEQLLVPLDERKRLIAVS